MLSKQEMHPKLAEFIEIVDELVKQNGPEEVLTQKVAEHMKELIQDESVFPDAYKQPNPDKYTLYPVYVAPDNSFSIASAVWDVGQSTPIHDHGTWGVIGLIQGEEDEIHYEIPSGSAPKKIMERKLQQGDVAVCCTSDQDVHEVACASNVPTVGIHVYGGNIGELERHVYDKTTGEEKTVVTAWDPVPAS